VKFTLILATQSIQNNRLVVDFFRGLPASSNNANQIKANMIVIGLLCRVELRIHGVRHWVTTSLFEVGQAMPLR